MTTKVNNITENQASYVNRSSLKRLRYYLHPCVCALVNMQLPLELGCILVTDRRHLDVPGYDRAGGRSLPSVVVMTGG